MLPVRPVLGLLTFGSKTVIVIPDLDHCNLVGAMAIEIVPLLIVRVTEG